MPEFTVRATWSTMTNTDRDVLSTPCSLCGMWFKDESQLALHKRGRRHLEQLASGSGGAERRAAEGKTGVRSVTINRSTEWLAEHARRAYARFRAIGSPRYVMAPMVLHSELPFRVLGRRHGAQLCYTPMIHAHKYIAAKPGRERNALLRLVPRPAARAGEKRVRTKWGEGGPVCVQFCSTSADEFLTAAKLVERDCDAVDINLGCPQSSARAGGFGAYLMDRPDVVSAMVRRASEALSIPVWCKIRALPTTEQTIAFGLMLQASGCSLLAIHARQRERSRHTGCADWDVIRKVKQALSIPVLANGNVQCHVDVARCLHFTKADGVMAASALLANPRMFEGFGCPSSSQDATGGTGSVKNGVFCIDSHCWGNGVGPRGVVIERNWGAGGSILTTHDRVALVLEYLSICEEYPVPVIRNIQEHIRSIFRQDPLLADRLNPRHRDLYSVLFHKKVRHLRQIHELFHVWRHRLGPKDGGCTCGAKPNADGKDGKTNATGVEGNGCPSQCLWTLKQIISWRGSAESQGACASGGASLEQKHHDNTDTVTNRSRST